MMLKMGRETMLPEDGGERGEARRASHLLENGVAKEMNIMAQEPKSNYAARAYNWHFWYLGLLLGCSVVVAWSTCDVPQSHQTLTSHSSHH